MAATGTGATCSFRSSSPRASNGHRGGVPTRHRTSPTRAQPASATPSRRLLGGHAEAEQAPRVRRKAQDCGQTRALARARPCASLESQNNGRCGSRDPKFFYVRSPNRPFGGLAVIAILAGFENLSASLVAQRGSKPVAGNARRPEAKTFIPPCREDSASSAAPLRRPAGRRPFPRMVGSRPEVPRKGWRGV